jgi:hypothetical protein
MTSKPLSAFALLATFSAAAMAAEKPAKPLAEPKAFATTGITASALAGHWAPAALTAGVYSPLRVTYRIESAPVGQERWLVNTGNTHPAAQIPAQGSTFLRLICVDDAAREASCSGQAFLAGNEVPIVLHLNASGQGFWTSFCHTCETQAVVIGGQTRNAYPTHRNDSYCTVALDGGIGVIRLTCTDPESELGTTTTHYLSRVSPP